VTVARRWAGQDTYRPLMAAAAARYGVPLTLGLAIAGVESGFRPTAISPSGSYGLMQLTPSTARLLGYTGTTNGLLDPATNVDLGFRLLRELLENLGFDGARVASAYNGGERPSLGFGTRLIAPLRLCLFWNDTTGTSCRTWYNAAAGEFGNQPYVDAVMEAYRYFTVYLGATVPVGSGPPIGLEDVAVAGSISFGILALSLGLAATAAALAIGTRRRRAA